MKHYFSNYNQKDWQKFFAFTTIMIIGFALPLVLILEHITKPAVEGAELVLKPFHDANLYPNLTPEQAYAGYIFVYLSLFIPYVPLIGYVFFFPFMLDLIPKRWGLNHLKNPDPTKV